MYNCISLILLFLNIKLSTQSDFKEAFKIATGSDSMEEHFDMSKEEVEMHKKASEQWKESIKDKKPGDIGEPIGVSPRYEEFEDPLIKKALEKHFHVFNERKRKSSLDQKQRETLKKLRSDFNHDDDKDEEFLYEIKDEYIEKLHEYKARKPKPGNHQAFLKKMVELEKRRGKEHIEERRRVNDQFAKHDEF